MNELRLKILAALSIAIFPFMSYSSSLNGYQGTWDYRFPTFETIAYGPDIFVVDSEAEIEIENFGNIAWTIDIEGSNLKVLMDDSDCCTTSAEFSGFVTTFTDPNFPGILSVSINQSETNIGNIESWQVSVHNNNAIIVEMPGGSDLRNNRMLSIDIQLGLNIVIDIKPGDSSNNVNLCSNGSTPVAIMGTDSFNVEDIDTDTLRFADANIKVVGKKDPRQLCSLEYINEDSYLDLVCHFNTADIAGVDGEQNEALLTGSLINGVDILGYDTIGVVKDSCN